MKTVDDRTNDQKDTFRWAVVARDNLMSGWGECKSGYSRCAWACKSLQYAEAAKKWVENREEMKYVNIVDLRTYRPPRGTAHFHIYVADTGHPALRDIERWESITA